MNTVAILTDITKCTGCESCVSACRVENQLGPDKAQRQSHAIDDLSSTRHTTILRRPGDHFVRQQCRHCTEPACVSACLVGAMQKTPEGPVVYDKKKCMGCRYCMVACPYGIPRYDWDKAIPYVHKCTMCYQRINDDKMPACTIACPEKATIFGTRDEMLKIARQRLKDSPNKYVQKIYGETEVGGTNVLYISDIPLDFLGCKPDMGDTAMPELTWAALSKVPPVILGMGGLMSGIYWIIGRRMKMQELEAAVVTSGSEEKE
jgi:formate dehydrogenase iron-sulfur subunit